ncbi:cell division protein ZapA [Comamonas sp. CMM01]|jgi:cell division protein ZapA|uniref:cell division protein ZapA n=1 Tax=Comamonas sp. CMM01 TaxID=2769280 RepID=UPI001782C5B3|nr:cell division protein ZapA [Comamonas sp. CMM01]MBD9534081.1 cell division protein ZapA [Comamonas sp. CMM01]
MSQIEARILQQDYVLTCPEGQEDMLLAAVQRVDADMERIRNTGKVRARERVGVLAAVNLAFESASLYTRVQELEQELELTLENGLAPAAPAADALPAAPLEDTLQEDALQQAQQAQEEAQALAAQLQELLALREHELQQAQALIERLEAALEVDSKLL